jgi:thioredoxin 1
MASTSIVTLTEANFAEDVLKETRPVLVDFWAEWCGPCKMVSPIIDELASDLDGKVKFGKVNVDEAQQLATQYGIRAVPTILIFHAGEVVEQVVGLRSKRDLKSSLDKYLDF